MRTKESRQWTIIQAQADTAKVLREAARVDAMQILQGSTGMLDGKDGHIHMRG